MPAFRRRMLTWLFWIASACATLTGWVKNPHADWLGLLLFAQLCVVSGWAAISEGHRLGRGAALILAPLALSATVIRSQRTADEAPIVLAYGLIMGGLVFAATSALALMLRMRQAPERAGERRRWQISIVEMLGWTIVVALASWAASVSKLPKLEYVHAFRSTLASSVPAAMIVAMFLAPRPRHDGASLVIVILGVSTFFAAAEWIDVLEQADRLLFAALFAYIACWVLVVRLDEAAVDRASASADAQRASSNAPPPVD